MNKETPKQAKYHLRSLLQWGLTYARDACEVKPLVADLKDVNLTIHHLDVRHERVGV